MQKTSKSNRQTNKEASKQASKQANKQVNKQAIKQANDVMHITYASNGYRETPDS